MERYVKKPIIVEAERWFQATYDREAGHGFSSEHSAIYHLNVGYYRHPKVSGKKICEHCSHTMHDHGWMDTLEGGHTVCPGDWIIRGIAGEMYPCKPDIFDATYEKYCPTNQKEVLDEDVAPAAPVLEDGISVGLPTPSEDDFQRNPAHYCFGCDKYLGHRGFCSEKCHDEHYDAEVEEINAELETLDILSDKDCMAGIRKSMEQINNGEGIPLSELYPEKPKLMIGATPSSHSNPFHFYEDDGIAKDSLGGKYG